MRHKSPGTLRLLVLVVLLVITTFAVACDSVTYVGVSYGYPGWGGPCCYGPGMGWGTGVYMGGPVW
jgi:hypothetical protein